MRKLILGFVGLTIVPCTAMPAAAQTIDSIYTKVEKCRKLKGPDKELLESVVRCPGYAGIAVYIQDADARSMISFGHNAANEPAVTQSLPAFNSGPVGAIEWRRENVPGRTPKAFATIVRWKTQVDDRESKLPKFIEGQVLVVTRLGPGGVCHVGYVDGGANPDANELARQIADTRARSFRCGKDKRIGLGKTGLGFRAAVDIE